MNFREFVIPASMTSLANRAGYVPAVKVGHTIYCAGQVGRTSDLQVIEDPENQFVAAWENLRLVLGEAGCGFDDVVDLTTYHVNMRQHMDVFRTVKDRIFPRQTCPWTCIGVTELAHPGLLVEIKCIAVLSGGEQPTKRADI
jgi:enamine deaminase RidA (YjgF/YER057c/UK114 family)